MFHYMDLDSVSVECVAAAGVASAEDKSGATEKGSYRELIRKVDNCFDAHLAPAEKGKELIVPTNVDDQREAKPRPTQKRSRSAPSS